jgi:hypothetical protein
LHAVKLQLVILQLVILQLVILQLVILQLCEIARGEIAISEIALGETLVSKHIMYLTAASAIRASWADFLFRPFPILPATWETWKDRLPPDFPTKNNKRISRCPWFAQNVVRWQFLKGGLGGNFEPTYIGGFYAKAPS